MKNAQIVIIVSLCGLVLWGAWATFDRAQNEPKKPSEMTQEERTQELRRTLENLGVELPKNWESMSKQERGAFLIDSDIVPAEMEAFFSN
ncbi:MAG TPA: hypothetical protein VIT68_02230 [Candidatus Gracilibacteria bacterium]